MTPAVRAGIVGLCVLASGCRIETSPPDAPGTDAASAEARPERADSGVVAPRRARAARPLAPSGLVIPVAGVAPGDLVDTFTAARDSARVHDAIDIAAPRGTPVVAAVSGRVLRRFTSERGGLTVYQLGPDQRTVYYYAHLDAYADGLADGQTLRQGQVIGTVGDSGNAAPGVTHLHFAIWHVEDPDRFWDGEALNPYPLLGGR